MPRSRGKMRPQDTGFVDYSRTNAGSSYHERMVTHRIRGRVIVAVSVVVGIILALACLIVSAGMASGK